LRDSVSALEGLSTDSSASSSTKNNNNNSSNADKKNSSTTNSIDSDAAQRQADLKNMTKKLEVRNGER
jgi:hypothetical protein